MTSVQHASWFPTAAPLRRAGRADLPSGLVERLDEIGGVVWGASIDPTGRYVVFASSAALTARDRNAVSDIYWYDSLHDQVVLVSAAPDGAAGDGPSSHPRMDRAGEVIVYQSDASDLVAGDQNTVRDIFLTDTAFWLTERLSMTVEGSETANPSSRPAIDHAGSQIVYDRADASGFRHIYSYATATMVTDRLSLGWDADGRRLDSYYPAISPDGRFLVYTETTEAVGFEPGLCTVHVLDQVTAELWSGACPESLEKEAGFVPFFSSDALSIEWIADPGERLPEQEAVGGTPQGVSLENPFLTP